MKLKNQIVKFLAILSLGITSFSCENNTTEIDKLPTTLDIIKADVNYTVLVKALDATSLTSTFTNTGSYTLFAPNNAAFAAYTSTNFPTGINDATFPALPATLTASQIAELKKLLQNHILGVGTRANDLVTNAYSKTFASGVGSTTLSMFVNKSGNDYIVNGGAVNGGAKITSADVDASNGVIQFVDNVIKLPTLKNHMIANPDLANFYTIYTSTSTGTYGDQSAVLATLSAAGPTTVFAPLNATVTTETATGGFIASNNTPANVSKILKYHMVNSNSTASSTTSWSASDATITTLSTQQFKITGGTVKIAELPAISIPASNIKTVNIQATNGVIHTVDRVLRPVLP